MYPGPVLRCLAPPVGAYPWAPCLPPLYCRVGCNHESRCSARVRCAHCAANRAKFTRYPGYDCGPGNEDTGLDAMTGKPTAEQCATKCLSEEKCKGFVMSGADCKFKSDTSTKAKSTGKTCYVHATRGRRAWVDAAVHCARCRALAARRHVVGRRLLSLSASPSTLSCPARLFHQWTTHLSPSTPAHSGPPELLQLILSCPFRLSHQLTTFQAGALRRRRTSKTMVGAAQQVAATKP